MDKAKLEELVVSEKDAGKAKALADIVVAKENSEADIEAARLKKEADIEKAKIEAETEKKSFILKLVLGIVSAISTIGLTLFSVFNHNRQDENRMHFEETGTCRSSTWKTKRDPIERVDVNVR